MEGSIKITQETKVKEPKIKEGVDFVFEQNPELTKVGTKEQYSEYLDKVFPESKVKDIVYHVSPNNFKNSSFSKEMFGQSKHLYTIKNAKGFFFGQDYSKIRNLYPGEYEYTVLLDIKNPSYLKTSDVATAKDDENYDAFVNNDRYGLFQFGHMYRVFNTEQIHILGSKQDTENFKKFVEDHKI
ncbi:MAG: hypothetical protein WCI41_03210 [bacterium]